MQNIISEYIDQQESLDLISHLFDTFCIVDSNLEIVFKSGSFNGYLGFTSEILNAEKIFQESFIQKLNFLQKENDSNQFFVEKNIELSGTNTTLFPPTSRFDIYIYKLKNLHCLFGFRKNLQGLERIFHPNDFNFHYRDFLNFIPEKVFIIKTDGTFIYINQLFLKDFMITKPELLEGKNITRYLHPNSLKSFHLAVERVISEGTIQKEQFRLKPIRKKEYIFEIAAKLITFENIDHQYIICTVKDITKEKNESEFIAHSYNFMRNTIDTFEDSFFIKDQNLKVIEVNEIACKMVGLTREQILGKTDHDTYPKIQADIFKEIDMRVLETGNTIVNEEKITWKGKVHHISTKKSLYIDPLTKKKYIVGISRDITRLKLKEAELVAAKERAVESDILKTTFLANMSHEIRTPMNSILGFSNILKDSVQNEDHKKFLDIICKNGETLLNLINEIVDISKIESGQMKINYRDFNLNWLINDLYDVFINEIHAKAKDHLELIVEKGLPDSESFIEMDEIRLRQMLTNLISNAIKFTDKGYIKFGYKLQDPNTLEFYVLDTGIGLSESKLAFIFDRFYQADSSLARKYGGTGLGLSITKNLIELFGGQIWVESKEGTGSNFFFNLPYRKHSSEPNFTNKIQIEHTKYDWSNKTILVVEDNHDTQLLIHRFLSRTQVNIVLADTADKAIESIRCMPEIDLVLMDIQLPGMNGLEATKIIKRMRSNLPVIAQTANALVEDKNKCIEAGCDDYLPKPINYKLLLTKIIKFF